MTIKAIVSNLRTRMARLMAVVAMIMAATTASAVDYFQRISMEGVELISAVTWGKIDEYTVMTPGYYEFSYDNKFTPDKSHPLFKAKALGGGAYHDGKIYSNEFASQSQDVKPMWRVYDAKTFKLLSEHQLSDNCDCTTTSLAYDQTSGYIYGFNETYTETYVVRINPETGEMTRLGNFLDRNYKFFALACSPNGELYCTYLNKNTDAVYLGKIRKSTGQVAMIRGISASNLLPGDSFINSSYEQAMFYNNATGKLYWMFQSSSQLLYKEYTAIFEVNPVTADAVMVAYSEDAFQGPGAFFLEPDLKAPAIIGDFEWMPDAKGSLSGDASFIVPELTYGGKPLEGKQTITVTSADGKVVATGSVDPGQEYNLHFDALPNGWNELYIHVSNSAGDGPTVKRRFFVGYDRPKAPSDIVLQQEGLHTVLTWKAPAEGVNGKLIDTSNMTYTVVRYPGEQTVAEGLKTCRFEEDHPGELTRYVYTVTPKTGNITGVSGMSNNLVVGNPVDVPYGGKFTSAYDMYNYYTILDNNADGYTWMFDNDSLRAMYHYNQAEAADDWLISPPVNYKAGKEYELTFSAYSSSSSYKESLQVTFGDGKTVAAQTTVLMNMPDVPAESEEDAPRQYKLRFTVPSDGVYYYAFHAISSAFRENLYVDNIKVTEYDPSSAVGRVETDGHMAVSQSDGMLRVELDAESKVSVSDMAGRIVAEGYGRTVSVPLGRGIYMVSANGKTVKTVVK